MNIEGRSSVEAVARRCMIKRFFRNRRTWSDHFSCDGFAIGIITNIEDAMGCESIKINSWNRERLSAPPSRTHFYDDWCEGACPLKATTGFRLGMNNGSANTQVLSLRQTRLDDRALVILSRKLLF